MVNLISSLRMLNREVTQLVSPFDEIGADMVTEVIAKKEQMLRKEIVVLEDNPFEVLDVQRRGSIDEIGGAKWTFQPF